VGLVGNSLYDARNTVTLLELVLEMLRLVSKLSLDVLLLLMDGTSEFSSLSLEDLEFSNLVFDRWISGLSYRTCRCFLGQLVQS
jgi:hypothetical protein